MVKKYDTEKSDLITSYKSVVNTDITIYRTKNNTFFMVYSHTFFHVPIIQILSENELKECLLNNDVPAYEKTFRRTRRRMIFTGYRCGYRNYRLFCTRKHNLPICKFRSKTKYLGCFRHVCNKPTFCKYQSDKMERTNIYDLHL